MKLLSQLCVLVIAHAALGTEEDLPNATLVVYNPNYPESKSLAEYYAARRGVPKNRLTPLPCSKDEEIDRREYDSTIAEPLRNHFQKAQLWTIDQAVEQKVTVNKVRYIVFIRGIPFGGSDLLECGLPGFKLWVRCGVLFAMIFLWVMVFHSGWVSVAPGFFEWVPSTLESRVILRRITPAMPVAPYDGRFVIAFRRELAKRGYPFYPEHRWHSALAAADLEAPCNCPPSELGTMLTPVQVSAHQRRLSNDKYLMASINQACDRWWRRHGWCRNRGGTR